MRQALLFSSVLNRRIATFVAATALVGALFLLPALCGCAAEQPGSPTAGLTMPIHPPEPPNLGRAPVLVEVDGPYSMYVTETVHRMCVGSDPFFAFDVSKPMGADQPTMKNLVLCMTSGPLQGKTIRLIGHTDPRGTAAYNLELGVKRAEKVKAFLVTNGIASARVETASMGAEDSAKAPKEWGTDRRVEVQLVP
jgi:peptidoglycan-associated lipoprotein